MRHPDIEAILDKPGIYRIDAGVAYFFIEVDEQQNVHQLIPATKQRDGILARKGWNDHPMTVTRVP